MAPKRVLVVEPAGPIRAALVRAIRTEGHEVVEAEFGELGDALARIRPDVIVGAEVDALAENTDISLHRLTKPVNMEELRRFLREG